MFVGMVNTVRSLKKNKFKTEDVKTFINVQCYTLLN